MAKEAEVDQFDEDLENLLELTSKKDVLFITRDCKSRKSRDTWSNGQVWALENKMKQGKG